MRGFRGSHFKFEKLEVLLRDKVKVQFWILIVFVFTGKVKEYGSPSALLDDPHSLFSSLVNEYTARSASYGDLVDNNDDEDE